MGEPALKVAAKDRYEAVADAYRQKSKKLGQENTCGLYRRARARSLIQIKDRRRRVQARMCARRPDKLIYII